MSTIRLLDLARMAARHDGFDLADPDLSFVPTPGVTSVDPIEGYTSIMLQRYYAKPAAIYTVRTATGDVINAFTCTLYRYPDLMKFREKRMKETGKPPVSPEDIDGELGCLGIKVAPLTQGERR